MQELKPCPFCGEQVSVLECQANGNNVVEYYILCDTELCWINQNNYWCYNDREEMVEFWNRRPYDKATFEDVLKRISDVIKTDK